MKPKVYIAGKIAGDPNYREKFNAAVQKYEDLGCIVLNPAALPEGMLPADYMRICFAMIDSADRVVFLDGCETSPGAQLELHYCLYTDKSTTLPACKHHTLTCMRGGTVVCDQCGQTFQLRDIELQGSGGGADE